MLSLGPGDIALLAALAGGTAWFLIARRNAGSRLSHPALRDLHRSGALVLDVRSPAEFRQGHIQGSRNVPLDQLGSRLADIPANRIILTVCASGVRSGMARRRLLKAGFRDVHNAGPWQTLKG